MLSCSMALRKVKTEIPIATRAEKMDKPFFIIVPADPFPKPYTVLKDKSPRSIKSTILTTNNK